jgi:hypothetical protein
VHNPEDPEDPECIQSLNFDWTGKPTRVDKVGSKVSKSVPIKDR